MLCRTCWEIVYLVQDEHGKQFYVSLTGKVNCKKRPWPPGFKPPRK